MAVTRKDVETVSTLARLSFNEEEKAELTKNLNDILGYFDKLSELDTEHVEPLTHILPVQNVMREDRTHQSFDQETALANAPQAENGHFVIPKVIE